MFVKHNNTSYLLCGKDIGSSIYSVRAVGGRKKNPATMLRLFASCKYFVFPWRLQYNHVQIPHSLKSSGPYCSISKGIWRMFRHVCDVPTSFGTVLMQDAFSGKVDSFKNKCSCTLNVNDSDHTDTLRDYNNPWMIGERSSLIELVSE